MRSRNEEDPWLDSPFHSPGPCVVGMRLDPLPPAQLVDGDLPAEPLQHDANLLFGCVPTPSGRSQSLYEGVGLLCMLLSYQCLVRIRLGHICLYQKWRGFWYCALPCACYDNEERCMGSPKLLPERGFDHWRKRSKRRDRLLDDLSKVGGMARTKIPVVRGNEVLFQLGGDLWIPEPARRKRAKGKGRGGLTAQPRPQANRRLNPRWHISIIMETVLGRNPLRTPTWATPLAAPAGGRSRHPRTVRQRSQEAFTMTAGGPRSRVRMGKDHCRGQRGRWRAPGPVGLRYALRPVDAVLAHGR